jgi:hypothetical protein
MLAEPGLQFDFPVVEPPRPPGWLVALLRALEFLGPALEILFWGGVILVAGAIVFFFAREAIKARWPQRKQITDPRANVHWQPKAARARTLLADADRLAAEGRYAEAVHLLLFRSIDDIEEWRPHVLKPDLTSRDIGMLEILPPEARRTFQRIAETVEASFFGGGDVDARMFTECRHAYAGFALSENAA